MWRFNVTVHMKSHVSHMFARTVNSQRSRNGNGPDPQQQPPASLVAVCRSPTRNPRSVRPTQNAGAPVEPRTMSSGTIVPW